MSAWYKKPGPSGEDATTPTENRIRSRPGCFNIFRFLRKYSSKYKRNDPDDWFRIVLDHYSDTSDETLRLSTENTIRMEQDDKSFCEVDNGKFRNRFVIDIAPDLLRDAHQVLDLGRCVDQCQVYRTIHDCPSAALSDKSSNIKAGAALTSAATSAREKWREVLRKHPAGLSGDASVRARAAARLLRSMQGLPERLWNEEWRIARRNVLVAEKKMSNQQSASLQFFPSSLLNYRPQRSSFCCNCGNQRTPPDVTDSSESIFDMYTRISEIQEEFTWFCTIVFQAILLPQARQSLVACLSEYYKSKVNWDNSKSTDVPKNSPRQRIRRRRLSTHFTTRSRRKETIHTRDAHGNLIDRAGEVFLQILNYVGPSTNMPSFSSVSEEETCSNDTSRPSECLVLLDWAATGFEFHGVWFQLIRGVNNWKTYKREVAFARRSMFDEAYPCPPLLCLCDAFQFQLGASALLLPVSSRSDCFDIVTPPHLPPCITTSAVASLNKALEDAHRRHSLPCINRIVPILPNPGRLLTAYAPRFIPLDAGGNDFASDTVIASALMVVSPAFPTSQPATSADMLQFGRSLAVALRILDRKPVTSAALLESGMLTYIRRWAYGWSLVDNKPKLSQALYSSKPTIYKETNLHLTMASVGYCPKTRLYALAFKSCKETPEMILLPCIWNAAHVLEFTSNQFQCDRRNVLPYDPVLEHGYYVESRDSPWKVEVLGYRCSVWLPTVSQSTVHELRPLVGQTRRPLRSHRRLLLQLPWESRDFVLVPAPAPIYLRPDLYLPTQRHTSTPVAELFPSTVRRIAALIHNEIPSVRSSGALHRIIHCFGLPVSVTLWELWIRAISGEYENPVVQQFVACDLVAAGVKRVIQYYPTNTRGDSQAFFKSKVASCLLYTLLNILPSSEDARHPDNINVVIDLLNLALWCSLVKASQLIMCDLQPHMVKLICDTARRYPGTLRTCIVERCRVQIGSSHRLPRLQFLNVKNSFPCSFALDPLTYPTLDSLRRSFSTNTPQQENQPESQSTSYNQIQRATTLLLSDVGGPPKLHVTLPGRDIVFRVLLAMDFGASASTSSTTLVAVCAVAKCIDFADCYLPFFAMHRRMPTRKPDDNFDVHHTIVTECLAQLGRAAPNLREVLRVALLQLLDAMFQGIELSLQGSEPQFPSSYDVDRLVVAVVTTEAAQSEPSLIASALLVSGLSKLMLPPYDEGSATECFKEAFQCLLDLWGDPTDAGEHGTISMLYLTWLLAMRARLEHMHEKGRLYERVFRAVRLLAPGCPLPLCLPCKATRLDGSAYTETTNGSISSERLLWNQHRFFLRPTAVRWISATHPLNCTTFNSNTFFPCANDANANEYLPFRVLSFGNNTNGCLGLGPPTTVLMTDPSLSDEDVLPSRDVWWTTEPTEIPFLRNDNIVDVAVGSRHNLVLREDGAILSWGANEDGQLGRSVSDAVLLDGLSSNADFSWLNEKGFILPGVGSRGSTSSVTLNYSSNITTSMSPKIISMAPSRITTFSEPIAQISCGLDFSAAVTRTGELFMWGCNTSGQLGTGDFQSRSLPTVLSSIRDPVSRISCGHRHTAAVTTAETLWLWGCGSDGQLGCLFREPSVWDSDSKDADALSKCIPVPSRLRILQCESQDGSVATAFEESRLARESLTPAADGLVWRQDPESHELFVTVSSQLISDAEERYNEEVQFLSVSCGRTHTLAVDLTNSVWSWGSGSHGELGLGVDIPETKGNPNSWPLLLHPVLQQSEAQAAVRRSPCRLPSRFFDHQRVALVSAGSYASAAIDQRGELWLWGSNMFNALTLPKDDVEKAVQPLRTRAFYPEAVTSIQFGWSGAHQTVITQNGVMTLWGALSGAIHSTSQIKEPVSWCAPPTVKVNVEENVTFDFTSVECTIPRSPQSTDEQLLSNTDLAGPSETHPGCYRTSEAQFAVAKVALGLDHCLMITGRNTQPV